MTTVLLTVIAFAIVWAGVIYFHQGSMIYYPRGYSAGDLARARERTRLLEYRIGESQQTAFYIPPGGAQGPSGPPRRLWIFFGGNASLALEWLELIDSLPDADELGFLLVDYPGYGLCEGKPSPQSIGQAIDGALRAYADAYLEGDTKSLGDAGVLGHSLGAAAALMAAEKFGMRRMLLLSPFTSMQDMAVEAVGRPLSHLLRHQYDNRAALVTILAHEGRGDSELELTIIHGEDDRVIPVEMGKALAGMAPDRIRWRPVAGADHNDLVMRAFPLLKEAIR